MKVPRIRFGLRTILIVVFCVCCYLAYAVSSGEKQKRVVDFVLDHGGTAIYEEQQYAYDWDETGARENYEAYENQPYPGWMQHVLNPNHYNSVVAIRFGTILIHDRADAAKFGLQNKLGSLIPKAGDAPMVIPYNEIDDEAFQALLARIPKLPKLRYLGLNGSEITDKHLMELAEFNRLKEIQLLYCGKLSTAAVERLRAKMPDCKIVYEQPSE